MEEEQLQKHFNQEELEKHTFLLQIRRPNNNIISLIDEVNQENQAVEELTNQDLNRIFEANQKIAEITAGQEEQRAKTIKLEKINFEIRREIAKAKAQEKTLELFEKKKQEALEQKQNLEDTMDKQKNLRENSAKQTAKFTKQIEDFGKEEQELRVKKSEIDQKYVDAKVKLAKIKLQNITKKLRNESLERMAQMREEDLEEVKNIVETTETTNAERLEKINQLREQFLEQYKAKEELKVNLDEKDKKREELAEQKEKIYNTLQKQRDVACEQEARQASLDKQITYAKLENEIEQLHYEMQEEANKLIEEYEQKKQTLEKEAREKEGKIKFEDVIHKIDLNYELIEKKNAQKRALIEQEHQRWLSSWRKKEREIMIEIDGLRRERSRYSRKSQYADALQDLLRNEEIPEVKQDEQQEQEQPKEEGERTGILKNPKTKYDQKPLSERLNIQLEQYTAILEREKGKNESRNKNVSEISNALGFDRSFANARLNRALDERKRIEDAQKEIDEHKLAVERLMNDLVQREEMMHTEKAQIEDSLKLTDLKIIENQKLIEQYKKLNQE